MKDDKDMNNIKNIRRELGENTTAYGEFVSSFFAWNTLADQKKIAEKLNNITKKKKEN